MSENNTSTTCKAPLVSVITIVYNNAGNIREAIESVLAQDYANIEYVIIDGGSRDGTVNIIKEYADRIAVFISERDNGIYDALNKGIQHCSGEILGILHSDDLYSDSSVITDSVQTLIQNNAEFCYSDLVIVNETADQVIRYYKSSYFKRWMFRIGWMPPHPTVFLKKQLFDEFGLYSTKYKVVGDFDFFVRIFFSRDISHAHLDRVTVKMRRGGTSNMGASSKQIIRREIDQSLKENNVWSHPALQTLRYLLRAIELIIRPKNPCPP